MPAFFAKNYLTLIGYCIARSILSSMFQIEKIQVLHAYVNKMNNTVFTI